VSIKPALYGRLIEQNKVAIMTNNNDLHSGEQFTDKDRKEIRAHMQWFRTNSPTLNRFLTVARAWWAIPLALAIGAADSFPAIIRVFGGFK
jgi:hypothetical protein